MTASYTASSALTRPPAAASAAATKPPARHSPWSSSTAVSSLTRPATSLTHDGCTGAAASRPAGGWSRDPQHLPPQHDDEGLTVTVNLIPVTVDREQATMPAWCDSWGIKSVRPDLRTYGGYQWPWPGQTAACDPNALVPANRDACPSQEGDGLCVATSWRGMASGGIPASTMLLVAYASSEALGGDTENGKLRLPRVAVVAVVDGLRLLRESGAGADLRAANLYCADLRGANLTGALGADA